MALKKVQIEKIVFVIPWCKTFNNVSTLYKILLEHNIDISKLNVAIDKKKYGSISSVLFFKNGLPVSEEIVIPKIAGYFVSYDNLLRNALSSFRAEYGFNTKKRIPILRARILVVSCLLFVVLGCCVRFFGHLMELKYQRPYELVEKCVNDKDFISQYGSEINGTNLNRAIRGSGYGKLLLSDEDFSCMILIEKEAFDRMSYSEAEQVNAESFNTLLIIKKYFPEYYELYVDIISRATLAWLKNPEVCANALSFYKQNLDCLPPWVCSFLDKYGDEQDDVFQKRWEEEIVKHVEESDFCEVMKTLMAQNMDSQ